MMHDLKPAIINEYIAFLHSEAFPCIAARAAIEKQQVTCLVVENMACQKDDNKMLQFLYEFVDNYRNSSGLFNSASIIFQGPEWVDEEMFERLLWQRLQSLTILDSKSYSHDSRIDPDPSSPNFSFSLKEEAFFIIGLHPSSSRPGRRFKYPTLAFNPHAQFEQLRQMNRYEKMKNIVRKRDMAYSGSVNPMLEDFGKSSEVYQYSGRRYDDTWQCPLKNNYESIDDHSSP
ncbi:MAG: guanitoxin biosynthesis heme-dependent pre-guanitoxin N-hydroxylase GntA [Bacteroidota bacterium]